MSKAECVVFICGKQPYKELLHLPIVTTLSRKRMASYARKQQQPLPSLPRGEFMNLQGTSVYMYHFKAVVGCRQTDSHQHKLMCQPSLLQLEERISEIQPNYKGIGSTYFYQDEELEYTLDLAGEKLLTPFRKPQYVPENEALRVSKMMEVLLNIKPKSIKHVAGSIYQEKFCPFSGGGDVFFIHTRISRVFISKLKLKETKKTHRHLQGRRERYCRQL